MSKNVTEQNFLENTITDGGKYVNGMDGLDWILLVLPQQPLQSTKES